MGLIIHKKFLVTCPDCEQQRILTYSGWKKVITGRCHKCQAKYNSGIFKIGHHKGLRFGKGQKEYRGEYTKERLQKLFDGRKKVKGVRNSNWKGGITPINSKIRNSKEYANWRKSVFERDNYTCQLCKIRGYKLNADHIKPFSLFPELRLDLSNGRTLCEDCHKKIGWNLFKENNPRRRQFALSI